MKIATNIKEATDLIKKAKKGEIIIFDETGKINWNSPIIKKLLTELKGGLKENERNNNY